MRIRRIRRIRRRASALLLLGGLVPLQGSAQGEEEMALAALAPAIEALTLPHEAAGLLSGIVLVSRGDQVLYEGAYGHANWELAHPVGPATRFGVASIAKPMTEILVRLLAAEGALELDAPVDTYLEGFPTGPDGGRPTVAQLLAHRGGIPHRVTEPWEESRSLLAADMVARIQVAGLLFEPGTDRLYSSAGYTALARVVELLTGRSFHDVLAERVFDPAGMRSASGETGQALMPERAAPYRLGADHRAVVVKAAPYKDLRFLTGAGAVFATAGDMVKFARAIRHGVFGPAFTAEVFGGDPAQWVTFQGRTNGYEASVDILPGPDLTLVFLSNLQSATNWQLRARLMELLEGRAAKPIPLPPSVTPAFEEASDLVGTFGPAEITLDGGRLFRGDNEFYPVASARYYIPASGTLMRFRRDAAGRVDALISISGSGEERVLPRSSGNEGDG